MVASISYIPAEAKAHPVKGASALESVSYLDRMLLHVCALHGTLNCPTDKAQTRWCLVRKEIEGMMAIVIKGDALQPDSIQKAFDQIEEVDAVVSTIGGTPADPQADSQVCIYKSIQQWDSNLHVRRCTHASA